MIKSYLDGLLWSELVEQSMDWNENDLPDNTVDMQYIKIAEEIKEYQDAKTKAEREKEAADIFISAIGLLRFCRKDLKIDRVIKKLDKLKKRKWKKVNGTYHH